MSSKQNPPRLTPGEKVLLELLAKIRLRIRSDKLPMLKTPGPQAQSQQRHKYADS